MHEKSTKQDHSKGIRNQKQKNIKIAKMFQCSAKKEPKINNVVMPETESERRFRNTKNIQATDWPQSTREINAAEKYKKILREKGSIYAEK